MRKSTHTIRIRNTIYIFNTKGALPCELVLLSFLSCFVSYIALFPILLCFLFYFVSYFSLFPILFCFLFCFVSYPALFPILLCFLSCFVSYLALFHSRTLLWRARPRARAPPATRDARRRDEQFWKWARPRIPTHPGIK